MTFCRFEAESSAQFSPPYQWQIFIFFFELLIAAERWPWPFLGTVTAMFGWQARPRLCTVAMIHTCFLLSLLFPPATLQSKYALHNTVVNNSLVSSFKCEVTQEKESGQDIFRKISVPLPKLTLTPRCVVAYLLWHLPYHRMKDDQSNTMVRWETQC